jgi:fatty acid desaturase
MVGISVFDIISSYGEKYVDFRKTLKPKYHIVWRDIVLGYVAIILLMAVSLFLEKSLTTHFWLFIPAFSFIGGYIIAYLQLFCHEAIHFNLHPDRKLNDVIANIFLFSFVGKDIKSCRKTHWKHHYFFGTTQDPQNAYFKPLSYKLMFRILFGIHFISNILFYRIIQFKNISLNKEGISKLVMFVAGITINLGVFLICLQFSYWQTGLIWLFSLTIFFPFFSNVRQILEYRNKLADSRIDYTLVDHGKVSRMFRNDFFSRTFGGAGFNKQMLHQLDPEISYTRFSDMELFLMNCPKLWIKIYKARTSYFDTYLWVIR